MPFYAVRRGFNTGVYDALESALQQVNGYSNNSWTRFETYGEAQDFVCDDDESEVAGGSSSSDNYPLNSYAFYMLVWPSNSP